MATSVNGWPVLVHGDSRLYKWTIPAKNGTFWLTLRNGSAGFILCHFLLWWSERLDDLTHPHPADDWGHAVRPIRGQTSGYSNHASGTATDADATQWPLGTNNMPASMIQRIRIRLRLAIYGGALRWGGEWERKDQMHTEIAKSLSVCERVAKRLMRTPRGKRLLEANPGQKQVILS